jgi:hypothetical protein
MRKIALVQGALPPMSSATHLLANFYTTPQKVSGFLLQLAKLGLSST